MSLKKRIFAAEQKKHIKEPKAFLFRIAKNVTLNELTRKSRQITDFIEDVSASVVIDTEASAEEETDAQEQIGLYCEAVAALPAKCRHAFLLRKSAGIGGREGAPGNSVSSHHCAFILDLLRTYRALSLALTILRIGPSC